MADRVRTHDAVDGGASAPASQPAPAPGGKAVPARRRAASGGKADHAGSQPNPAREPVPVTHVRRYRRREVALADGARLVLAADGTLTRFDAEGTPEHTWAPDDPEWPRLAIRFGLRSQPRTVTPAGRFVEAAKLTRPGG